MVKLTLQMGNKKAISLEFQDAEKAERTLLLFAAARGADEGMSDSEKLSFALSEMVEIVQGTARSHYIELQRLATREQAQTSYGLD